MTARRDALPAIVVLSVAAVILAAVADAPSTLRIAVVAWFLVACPGLAVVPLLRLPEQFGRWTLIVSLSVSVDILVAMTFMYTGLWSAAAIFSVLAAISLFGAALQLRAGREERA